jgi:hypothetical protein
MRDARVATRENVSSMANNENLLVLGIAANGKYIIVFHHVTELGASGREWRHHNIDGVGMYLVVPVIKRRYVRVGVNSAR